MMQQGRDLAVLGYPGRIGKAFFFWDPGRRGVGNIVVGGRELSPGAGTNIGAISSGPTASTPKDCGWGGLRFGSDEDFFGYSAAWDADRPSHRIPSSEWAVGLVRWETLWKFGRVCGVWTWIPDGSAYTVVGSALSQVTC